jgi:hypothetical protein
VLTKSDYSKTDQGMESNRRHGDFQSRNPKQAVSHQFQPLRNQALSNLMLEYVRLCWVIFGSDGYNIVTVERHKIWINL